MSNIIDNFPCVIILSIFDFEITVGIWLTSMFVASFLLMCPEDMYVLISHVSLPNIAFSLRQQQNQTELTVKLQLRSITKIHKPQTSF